MGRTIYEVGTKVSKSFYDEEIQQERPYIGKVVSYNPKRKLYKIKYDEDDDSEELSDSEMDDVVVEQKKKRSSTLEQYRPTHFQAKYGSFTPSRSTSKTHLTSNHSVKDSYTGKDLPKGKPFVYYENGEERYYYSLDTIYRRAIYGNNNNNTKPKFLQPPEFKEPMDDDLIDQISNKFGRSALNIKESRVYKDINRVVGYDMESKDLYCCPICYIEAYRRQGNIHRVNADDAIYESEESGSESDSDDEDLVLFKDDPMTILNNAGLHKASTFCFVKLRDVKRHVKDVHGFNSSIMRGNALFHGFRVSLLPCTAVHIPM